MTEKTRSSLKRVSRAMIPTADPLLEALVRSNIVVVFEDGARKFVEFDSRAARWYAASELLEPPPPQRARWW